MNQYLDEDPIQSNFDSLDSLGPDKIYRVVYVLVPLN